MSIVLYYSSKDGEHFGLDFAETELSNALNRSAELRSLGFVNVTISSEPSDHVGKMGVDAVTNGKTPDGHEYSWKKRR